MRRASGTSALFASILGLATARAEFVEVTEAAFGVQPWEIGGWAGAYWPDVNDDGWPDIHVSTNYLHINNTDGTFTLVDTAGLDVEGSSSAYRASWADADNDGDLDCVQSCYSSSSAVDSFKAYYYECDGPPDFNYTRHTYYEIPVNTRTGQPLFVDGDGDGFTEIYQATFGNWDPYGRTFDRYFDADGGETWDDVTISRFPELADPLYERHSRGVVACDYDDDRDIDIFVPVYGVDWADPSWENLLWQNDGTGTFVDVAAEAGVAIEPHGLYGVGLASGASWGDYDNDGDFDLAVANIHGWVALFRNDGDGTFTNVTNGSGLFTSNQEWHNTAWVDVDNDADLDLFCSQWYGRSAFIFENEGPEVIGHFRMANADFGLDHATVFRGVESGIGAADYDRDGDMDLFYDGGGDGFQGKHLFRNELDPGSADNHWLVVHLVGDGTSCATTPAGARIRIEYPDDRSGIRQVETTSADQTMHMQSVHFGLAAHDSLDRISVSWPCGLNEYWTWQDLGEVMDQWITLAEGSGTEIIAVGDPIRMPPPGLAVESLTPNPAARSVTLRMSVPRDGATDIEIFDVRGRLVHRERRNIASPGRVSAIVDVAALPPGVYGVKVSQAGAASLATKLVLSR